MHVIIPAVNYTLSFYHLKCSCGGQSFALPHHLVCSKGGHCRPAPFGCLTTSLRLCISPIPHDTLHALHSDQLPTRQSRYPASGQKRHRDQYVIQKTIKIKRGYNIHSMCRNRTKGRVSYESSLNEYLFFIFRI